MGVSKAPHWNNLQGKPTTVAGLGLSDFAAQAIAAQAGITSGAVGTYIIAATDNVSVANGATVAGSSLRLCESAHDMSQTVTGTGLAGTWRCITRANVWGSNASSRWQYGPALYMRIS